MNKIMLNDLKLGESGYVRKIFLTGNIKRRLQELGFVDGSLIKYVLKSPLNDPKAYFIKGTTIAIREEIAKNILIERI